MCRYNDWQLLSLVLATLRTRNYWWMPAISHASRAARCARFVVVVARDVSAGAAAACSIPSGPRARFEGVSALIKFGNISAMSYRRKAEAMIRCAGLI